VALSIYRTTGIVAMSEQGEDSLGSGLVLEEYLPITWAAQNAPLDPIRIAGLQSASERVMNTVLALEDSAPEIVDEFPGKASELQRLDFKVNLLLDLVGQVVAHQLSLPPRAAVRLGADRIEWNSANPPAAGQMVVVQVYLNLRFPRPVNLLARVQSVSATPKGSIVRAVFESMEKSLKETLEKLIFRSHRRQVASHKQHGGGTR
jgi:hypothetical protein